MSSDFFMFFPYIMMRSPIGFLWLVSWLLTFIIGAKKGIGCLSAIVGVLGPIGLIVVILDPGYRVKCPYCRELIDKMAVKCPRCQTMLNPSFYKYQNHQAKVANHPNQNIVGQANQIIYNTTNMSDEDFYAQQILNRVDISKYCALDTEIVNGIRDSVFDHITKRSNLSDGLKYLLKTVNEDKREIVTLYANTMMKDYYQAVNDANASIRGELYWEFVGPDDELTCKACADLLSIRYFSNAQRRKAEKETADDREFGCGHMFCQISREKYEASLIEIDSRIDKVHNPDMVSRILES